MQTPNNKLNKNLLLIATIILSIITFFGFLYLLFTGSMALKQSYSTEYIQISKKYAYEEECGVLPMVVTAYPTKIVLEPFIELEEKDSIYFITQWCGKPDLDTTKLISYNDYYYAYKKQNKPKYYIIDAKKDTLIGTIGKKDFEKAKKQLNL